MTPQGTVVVINKGHVGTPLVHWIRRLPGDVDVKLPMGNQIPAQRNRGVAAAVGAWVLFVDSDSAPPAGALARVLNWAGADIVGAVVCERTSPFQPVAVKTLDPPARYTLTELKGDKLLPAVAVGTGFVLVRRPVFDRVAFPWYRCGQIIPDLLLEDTDFCIRAGQAGVQTYVDCGLRVGHAAQCIIWPGADGRPWVQWDGPADHREPVDHVPALGAEVAACV